MTTVSLPMLSRVKIASPCPVKWDDMQAVGDGEQVRHCDQCDLNVYNLSAMTADDAEALLVAHEGERLCAGFYRREDGTVLTRDCPVGLALVRAKLARVVARASAVLGLAISSAVLFGDLVRGEPARLRTVDPFARIVAWLNPAAPLPLTRPVSAPPGGMMRTGGVVAFTPPPPPVQQTPVPPQASGDKSKHREIHLTGSHP